MNKSVFVKQATLLAACAGLALTAAAVASPQETVTYSAVDSAGAVNGATNQIRTNTFVGGYAAKSIRISGSLTKVNSGTFRSEARIMVIPPSGATFELQPALQGSYVGPGVTNDLVLPIPTPIADAAGLWTFRFYESFDDGSDGLVDSTWSTITFTLDDALPQGLTSLGAGPVYTEVEPNDNTFANQTTDAAPTAGTGATLGGANYIPAMAVGQSLTGSSTGTSTTVAGAASADNFLIRVAPDVAGIYRYQLTLSTTGTAGHTATLRGFTQNTDVTGAVPGTILVGSDSSFQSHVLSGTSRVNQFYGFGKGEQVNYRVTGGSTTTAPYTSVLSRTTITPIPITGTLGQGSVTISRASGNTNTVDMMLFDANLNAIVGANTHSSTTVLTRSLAAGTYYLAVSNAVTAQSLASASDSTTRVNVAATMPDFVMNSSATTLTNMNMTVTTGSGAGSSTTAVKAAAFDVAWFTFTLTAQTTNPTGVGAASPSSVLAGVNPSLLTVNVSPGQVPTSTGLAVSANLSAIGGSATQTFYDDGTNGDVTAGDNIFSYSTTASGATAAGSYSLPFTVTDAQSRSGTGNITLGVQGVIDLGTASVPQSFSPSGMSIPAGGIQWLKVTVPAISNANLNWMDMWTTAPAVDTEIAVYNASGNFIATDDDGGVGALSQLSFGLVTPTRPDGGSDVAGNGRNGALAAGTYYIGIGIYNVTWNATNWSTSSTGAAASGVAMTIDIGAQSNPIVTGNSSSGLVGGSVLITGTVTSGVNPASTGLAVNANLTSLGGGATNAMHDDGLGGDAVAGDNIFSLLYTIPGATATGSYSVPLTVTDAQARSGNGTATVAVDDAGDTIATAKLIDGSGSILSIAGSLGASDADMFRIHICDPMNFSATLVGNTTMDTQLFLFNANGTGVAMDDDDPTTGVLQSHLFGPLVNTIMPGDYYLAISQYDKDPVDAGGNAIWADTPFNVVRVPDGVSPAAAIDHWDTGGGTGGTYTITLTGVSGQLCCHGPCVADFDDGSGNGVPDQGVTIDDLLYYLQIFQAGALCADVDDGSGNGIQDGGVTIDDLLYYLARFASGC